MGRPRNRRRPVQARESGSDLRVALNNAELAERRAYDGARLQESIGELEQRLSGDAGWRRFAGTLEQEFSADGIRQMRGICRLASISNPLLKRGLSLRSAYVHGQGVSVTARANGRREGEQDVQAAVAAFWGDEGNQRAYTGAGARDRLERALGTDGEIFVALFTRPMTGDVQVRVLLTDEIDHAIICNPEDRTEPWYYRRRWVEQSYDAAGNLVQAQREQLHPAINYRPASRPKRIGTVDIAWDAPVLHIDVNRPEHWQHGIPDTYAAINWARAYKTYLEQWATLMSALSKFAWRTTAGSAKQAQQMRTALTSSAPRSPDQMGQADIGQTMIVGDGRTLEAIPKSGATIDAESGRPLAMMVAAALDVPVTMLLSDPGQTGARAVAETLDQPTELAMGQRRDVWTAADRRILRYIITESVRAPRGALKGTIRRDQFRDRETVELAGDTDDTIDIIWPDLDDTSVKDAVDAIAVANTTGTIPPEQILRLLLAALGVRDADTIVEALVDEDGTFHWPGRPTAPPQRDRTPGANAPDATAAGASPAVEALRESNPTATADDPVDEAWQSAVDAFLTSWPALAGPMVSALADSSARVVRTGNVSALGGLAVPAATLRDITRALRQSMTGLADEATRQVAAEAAAQGADTESATPDEGRLAQVAAATAALIGAGYAATAGQAALAAPTATVATAVTAALTDLGAAQRGMIATHVAAALHAAQHEGRRAMFEANPPDSLTAWERHADRNRCQPCEDANGNTYATLAEALADYPGLGGNIHCLGGIRCRGRLVGHWTTDGEDAP